MLRKLVLISNGNMGFYKEGVLVSPDEESFGVGEHINIAHCVDHFQAKVWNCYQKYCFDKKISQAFKQVFRELYIPSADELAEGTISRRYAGHQIQVGKAMTLLKSQQWSVNYDSGIQKINLKDNCIAQMYSFADWYSPADIEAPCLETISFYHRNKNKCIPFEEVDPKFFSETMRDLDLVVSIAHIGEVDPEASQSCIELRSVIIKESCRLFKLQNTHIEGQHIKIEGKYGNYSVHMGSGVTHKQGSHALYIIPVHSQHRGRMFLPFMDEDPKTAEIMSKVLLLAKDHEIQDPSILDQISK